MRVDPFIDKNKRPCQLFLKAVGKWIGKFFLYLVLCCQLDHVLLEEIQAGLNGLPGIYDARVFLDHGEKSLDYLWVKSGANPLLQGC